MVSFSIIPYPDVEDDKPFVDWLAGYELHVNEDVQVGAYPKSNDFLDVINSSNDFRSEERPDYFGLDLRVMRDENTVQFSLNVSKHEITDIRFNGDYRIAEIIMRKLSRTYGSFVFLADGEPMLLITGHS